MLGGIISKWGNLIAVGDNGKGFDRIDFCNRDRLMMQPLRDGDKAFKIIVEGGLHQNKGREFGANAIIGSR